MSSYTGQDMEQVVKVLLDGWFGRLVVVFSDRCLVTGDN